MGGDWECWLSGEVKTRVTVRVSRVLHSKPNSFAHVLEVLVALVLELLEHGDRQPDAEDFFGDVFFHTLNIASSHDFQPINLDFDLIFRAFD